MTKETANRQIIETDTYIDMPPYKYHNRDNWPEWMKKLTWTQMSCQGKNFIHDDGSRTIRIHKPL